MYELKDKSASLKSVARAENGIKDCCFIIGICVGWSSNALKKVYPKMATELDQAVSPNRVIVRTVFRVVTVW